MRWNCKNITCKIFPFGSVEPVGSETVKSKFPSSFVSNPTISINKDLFTEYTFRTIVSEVIVLTAIKYQLLYDLKGKIKDEPLRN